MLDKYQCDKCHWEDEALDEFVMCDPCGQLFCNAPCYAQHLERSQYCAVAMVD